MFLQKFTKKNHGIAVLPMVILMGVIIFEIAIAGSFVMYYTQQSGPNLQKQVSAFDAAQAGIDDILLRLARNKDLPSGEYTISGIANWDVKVEFQNNVDPAIATSTAVAPGSFFSGGKKLEAQIYIDSITGTTSVSSLIEVEL